jgi:hypothetical protein
VQKDGGTSLSGLPQVQQVGKVRRPVIRFTILPDLLILVRFAWSSGPVVAGWLEEDMAVVVAGWLKEDMVVVEVQIPRTYNVTLVRLVRLNI